MTEQVLSNFNKKVQLRRRDRPIAISICDTCRSNIKWCKYKKGEFTLDCPEYDEKNFNRKL